MSESVNNGRDTTGGLAFPTISRVALQHTVMAQPFGQHDDRLGRHRDRYRAPERNVGIAEIGPIGVRIEASVRG